MKIFIVSLFALCIATGASAQINVKTAVGFSVTDFSEDGNEVKAKYGTQAGASVAFFINDRFYVEPGLFSTSKSTEFETSTSTASLEAYVEGLRIPISTGFILLGDVDTFANLRVFGGPSGYFITTVGRDVNKEDFKRFNWGFFSGAAIDVWRVYVEVSYEWSLTDIQKNVSDIDLGKQRSVYVNFGYKFKF
jgi:hypothetical protein